MDDGRYAPYTLFQKEKREGFKKKKEGKERERERRKNSKLSRIGNKPNNFHKKELKRRQARKAACLH